MPANDNALNQGDELTAAAHAAASWVRARRAQWTSAPAAMAAAPAVAPPAFDRPVFDLPVFDPVAPTAHLPAATAAAPPAAARPTLWRTWTLGAAMRRWLLRGAIAAAVVTAGAVAGPRVWQALPAVPSLPVRSARVEVKPAAVIAKKPVGALRIGSTPPGARVLVDGKPRGLTPLDLADVSPGRHEVALQSAAGVVTRTVTVAANTTVTIDEAIFSGFVTVYAPFDVTISDGGRVLRADDHQQIMLAPGTHELRITNRTLGFEAVRTLTVKPGEATNLQLSPDPSALTVTASEAAEVWLDGTRLGDTPLNAAPVALGVHELLVKKATGGERRFTVTVGVKPFTVAVDF
ncbi:MAG: hypothetical protein JWL71_1082 [Acidobacteria bacterium]|nr:hypothetical protein [Acidobacteriota bacterium]